MEESGEVLYTRLSSTLRSMQITKTQVLFFNDGLSDAWFFAKVALISSSALSGYVFIRQLGESQYLEVFSALLIFILSNLCYLGVVNSAFRIPEGIRRLKDEIRVQSQKLINKSQQREVRMRLAAIPSLAIRVGRFQQIERYAYGNEGHKLKIWIIGNTCQLPPIICF